MSDALAVLMRAWTFTDSNSRFNGYAVRDALGVRLGYISGIVVDDQRHVRLIEVNVTEWSGSTDYLVPVGAITLISDRRSIVQLRDVTKQSIGRLCYRHDGELPESRLLVGLTRHFPTPRASVIERLQRLSSHQPFSADRLSWTRLSDLVADQDTSY